MSDVPWDLHITQQRVTSPEIKSLINMMVVFVVSGVSVLQQNENPGLTIVQAPSNVK